MQHIAILKMVIHATLTMAQNATIKLAATALTIQPEQILF